jgi:threonine/homoserine/homoserine lactone efflux protein
MTLAIWGWYLLTETVLSLSPGPAVFFVVSQALQGGRRRAVWATLGILSANTLYFALSAVGLGTVLAASYELFRVIKWVGAAYLVYLGLRTFFGKGTIALAGPEGEIGKTESTIRSGHERRTWMRGIVMQVANPKALLFFTALLPQFIRPGSSVTSQILVLGITSIVAEFIVLSTYGALAGRLGVVARQPRFLRTTNRISGALLVGAGAGIALASER